MKPTDKSHHNDKSFSIVFLPGDGVGTEVAAAARRVLEAAADTFGYDFKFSEALIGGVAIDQTGDPLPQATVDACLKTDAVFLGAVGGPKWDGGKRRPEEGLLGIRKALGLFANLRPVAVPAALLDRSPFKPEVVRGVDMLIVRELTGGSYFGEKTRTADTATDLCVYTTAEIERVTRVAFKAAQEGRGHVTSVDKANVMETSRLWREVVSRIAREEFPDVELEHLLVDSAAMRLIQKPRAFDVILTENMFGDILSDLTAGLIGGMGMAPSADIGDRYAVFQPCHGTAPDIMGQGKANPTAMILSAAMMLDWLADKHGLDGAAEAAENIERAVDKVYAGGIKPFEFGGSNGTADVARAVLASL